MIWRQGAVLPDDALQVSVLDRTFEHGLGLFETFRTWGGRPRWLSRHLGRLRRSAEALGLPLNSADLPGPEAVEELTRQSGLEGDALLRITVSGGIPGGSGSVVWMRGGPITAWPEGPAAKVWLSDRQLNPTDLLSRHKTLNYWPRRLAHEEAKGLGADEALLMAMDNRYWEGTRTNLFAWSRGTLVTPSLAGPILPGVLRGLLLELAREQGLPVAEEESGFSRSFLGSADEVFLTNAARGIIPVGEAIRQSGSEEAPWRWPAPGPLTTRLIAILHDRLHSEGP